MKHILNMHSTFQYDYYALFWYLLHTHFETQLQTCTSYTPLHQHQNLPRLSRQTNWRSYPLTEVSTNSTCINNVSIMLVSLDYHSLAMEKKKENKLNFCGLVSINFCAKDFSGNNNPRLKHIRSCLFCFSRNTIPANCFQHLLTMLILCCVLVSTRSRAWIQRETFRARNRTQKLDNLSAHRWNLPDFGNLRFFHTNSFCDFDDSTTASFRGLAPRGKSWNCR